MGATMGIGLQELIVIAFLIGCPVVTIAGVIAIVVFVMKKSNRE